MYIRRLAYVANLIVLVIVFSMTWNKLVTQRSLVVAHETMTCLLLTESEGRTGKYWPEAVAGRTERERSEVRTKTTEGQYSAVRLEIARLVSSLLYGTRAMLVLNLPAFENRNYTAYDRFHRNGPGPYGEIQTKKEPTKTLRFPSRLLRLLSSHQNVYI